MRREGSGATVIPGPGHVTYECIFVDEIARNSLCCEVVNIDLLHREEGPVANKSRLMEKWYGGLAHFLLFRCWWRETGLVLQILRTKWKLFLNSS